MTQDYAFVRENLLSVRTQIEAAANRAGREVDSVKLVVVSKNQPVQAIQAAIATGATIFGENYAEQSIPKITEINNPQIQWHMIGHVQSRKAGLVAEHFAMVHSLDSLKLAQRIGQACEKLGRILPVLLECNLAGEETKSGWRIDNPAGANEFFRDIPAIASLPGLEIRGLMTMPPLSSDAVQTRSYFRGLVSIRDRLTQEFPSIQWTELSMGTSSDFTIAIEEGATYVRVGTAILGQRSK